MNDPRYLPLPNDVSKLPEHLARDLAWGVLNGKWKNYFMVRGIPGCGQDLLAKETNSLKEYLDTIWSSVKPNVVILIDVGYLQESENGLLGDDIQVYKLTEPALRLAKVAQPGPVFISYRRKESTTFA